MDISDIDTLRSALSRIGLSPIEIAAYENLLVVGSRPASLFARESGCHRGNAYQVLLSLRDKGLVQEVMKNNVKQFSPLPISTIVERLELLLSDMAQARKFLAHVLLESAGPLKSMTSH